MYSKWKRATVDSVYDTFKAQSCVLERAKEIQATLDSEFPSLVKTMLPSHVTGGFWLVNLTLSVELGFESLDLLYVLIVVGWQGLPKRFCHSHLPKNDSKIVLEDESGEAFQTKYLVQKVGLSAGWRGFSIAHKLMEGDIVVFHLVKPFKFKVVVWTFLLLLIHCLETLKLLWIFYKRFTNWRDNECD